MEGAIGSGLLETFDRSVHCLTGGGESAGGQHLDLLGVSDFSASIDNLLLSLLKFLSEVSKLQHLALDKGIPQLLYGSINDELVGLSRLEDALSKRVEWGLCAVAGSCA